MGVDRFAITLDTPEAVFAPGSPVNGKVEVESAGDDYVYSIEIQFAGIAYTKKTDFAVLWANVALGVASASSANNRCNQCRKSSLHCHHHMYNYYHHDPAYFSSKDTIFLYTKTLFGNNSDYQAIPLGLQSFPFSFQLPPTPLPHSCTIGSNSFVSYTLHAAMIKPWYRFNVKSTPKSIKVVTPISISSIIGTSSPISVESEVRFGWIWKSGPLKLAVTVNPSGCQAGDTFTVTINLENNSDKGVSDLSVELLREWTLTASSYWSSYWRKTWKHWKENDLIQETRRGEYINIERNMNWQTKLKVPADELPSMLGNNCDAIGMKYIVRVTAYVDSYFSSNHIVEVPVTIGSRP